MSKYAALQYHLLNMKKDKWKAGFSEIEDILGFTLPESARHYQAWWANNNQNSRHTKVWLDAGWKTGEVNFGNETVIFHRQDNPERADKAESPSNAPYKWDQVKTINCGIRLEWKPLGKVTVDQLGRLSFPKAEQIPAIYRFRIQYAGIESVYIGETDNLNRRFGNYRNPGPSQKTSLRINAALKEALGKGAKIALSAVTANAWIDQGKGFEAANLTSKVVRCLLENAAILANGGGDIEMLNRAKI